MGKSYAQKVKNRSSRINSTTLKKTQDKPDFPLVPFVMLGIIVMLIVAGVVMYSLDQRSDDNGSNVINDNGGNNGDGGGSVDDSGEDDIILDTTDGGEIFLDQYKGKVVVLDMFATWCNPCIIQMGELEELDSRFLASELVILSVGADLSESMDLLRSFKEQEGADWPFARSNQQFNARYPATSIPTMYILDTNGNIAKKHVGVTDADVLESEVRGLL